MDMPPPEEHLESKSHRAEGNNARVTVKISRKPKFGKDELKSKYKVEKYTLSEGYSMGATLQSLIPKDTPEYVEHGENYVERIMRALYHFKQCALIGPSGTGKSVAAGEPVFACVDGKQTLTTVDALFESLARRFPVVRDQDGWETLPLAGADVRILSMDLTTDTLGWRRPFALARSAYRGDIINVTTSRNRSISATPGHSFLVDGVQATGETVKKGSRLPIARHIPALDIVPTKSVAITDYVPGAKMTEQGVIVGGRGAIQIPAPAVLELNEDFAWFLGFFAAEGYVGEGFASIYNKDPDLIERCTVIAASLGLSTTVRRQRGLIELRVFSKAFISFLSSTTLRRRVGTGKGSQALYKMVPEFVYSMDDKGKAAFLRGFIDGDGWQEESSEVLLGTSSRELAYGLIILCEQLGIFPTLRVKSPKVTSYSLVMARDGAAKLGVPISGMSPSTDFRGHVEKVAVTPEMIAAAKAAYKRLPDGTKSKKLHKRTVSAFYSRTGTIGLGSLSRIANELESPELAEVARTNVLWDEVKEVRRVPYDGWVYDFQVPGNETFVSGFGGVVTHNTHIVYLVAELAGLPLWEVNCGLQTSVYDLFGRFVGLGKENWIDGQIVSWCRYGGILYLDEANMMKQDIATRLNPLLDTRGHMVLTERDNEVIPRHPNGYVIISMNPYSAEFAGTKPLNAAFRRRMSVWIDFDYLSLGNKIAADEVEMIAKRAKIDTAVAEKIVRVAAEMRRQYKAGDLPYAPSVGDLVNWATLVADGLSPAQAAEETIIALTADDPDVQNGVRRVVRMVVGEPKAAPR